MATGTRRPTLVTLFVTTVSTSGADGITTEAK
jgi:hypothetical protein